MRWQIEELFRLLKTKGLRLENSQLSSGIALQKLTVMALGVALQSMQLVKGRQGACEHTTDIFFSKQEAQFLYALATQYAMPDNPHPAGSLAWGQLAHCPIG